MGFWNYLGLAILYKTLFGKNKRKSDYPASYFPIDRSNPYSTLPEESIIRKRINSGSQNHRGHIKDSNDNLQDPEDIDDLYLDLSQRMDDLESRLNDLDPESVEYDEMMEEVEQIQDRLDSLDDIMDNRFDSEFLYDDLYYNDYTDHTMDNMDYIDMDDFENPDL